MIPLLALSACDTVPVMFSISKVNMHQYFQETFISAPGKDLIFFETESLETKNRWNKVIVKPSEKKVYHWPQKLWSPSGPYQAMMWNNSITGTLPHPR